MPPRAPVLRRRTVSQFAPVLRITLNRLRSYAIFMVLVVVSWSSAIWLFHVPAFLMPSPAATLGAFSNNLGKIGSAALFTCSCTLIGIVLSIGIAIALAVAFLKSDLLTRTFMPLLIILRTIPVIAIAPLIILVLGRGQWNSIGIVALLTFFQIMLATRRGFLAPSANTLEMMHVYGGSFRQTLLKVRVPFALPYLFTGVRIASSSAILCAMFAEWLSGAPGLGRLLFDSYSTQNLSLMWAALLVGTTSAYLFFTLTIAIEQAILAWGR
jgi:ABC-type nitrate/sulfonate/bicarbonate transport system permease component